MTWQWRQAAANILLKQPDNLTDLGPEDSHIKDGMSGAYLAELIAALTDDRAYTLQDADMTLAALNLAQTWTALQSFLLGESPATSVGFHVMNTGGVELITDAANRDFSSGNAWSGSNWSTASGALVHTPTSSVVANLANANLTAGSILSGRYYIVTFTCTVTAGTFAVRLGTASSGTIAASGTYTVAILATANDADFNILPLSTFNGSIDNISLKRLAAEFVIRNDGHIGVGTDTPDTDSWYHVVTYDPGTAKFKVENKAQGSGVAVAIEVKHGASGQRVLLIYGGPETNSTTFEAFSQRGALMTDPTLGLGLSLVARQSAGDIRFYIGGVASSNRVMTLYSTHLAHAHCYGSMYQDDTGTTITVSATNTDYIVTGMSSGAVNQFTFQNNQELKCLIPGKYKVTWSVSFVCGSANQEVEGAVGVNGTRQAGTSAHVKVTTASADQCMSGTGILTLAVNDLVQIVVRNETSTANIIVDHANLTLDWVGA